VRILHVASGDLWAGAEIAVSHIVRETARRPGLSVRAVVLNDGMLARSLRSAGVPVDVLPERGRSVPSLAGETVRIARRFGPEVVHTHRYKEHLIGACVAVRTGALHVRTAHGRGPLPTWRGGPAGLGGLLDDAVASWTGSVWIAVSEELAASLSGLRRRVHVVPNGIPAAPPEPARTELLRGCGVSDGIVVGFVGRLEPVKRPDRFLRIARALPPRATGRPVVAVLVGDGSMAPDVEAAVRTGRAGPPVTLLPPVESGERLVAALDVLVIPSDHEGLPLVLLEAMRSSVAVVATEVGGIVEAVAPCRWLAPPEDEAALTERVRELVSDPAARGAWGAALHARFSRRYTIEAAVDRTLEVYDRERRGAA